MKKILLLLSLLISSVQTECMFRLGKLALGKIGLAAGISTNALYGGIKKSSCEPVSTLKTNPELIVFSENTLRDACKKCNVSIVGNYKHNWINAFDHTPISGYEGALLGQIQFLANAAHMHAPLGEKEHAEQAVLNNAPCVFKEILKDNTFLPISSEQAITELSEKNKWYAFGQLNRKYPLNSTSRIPSPESIESIKKRKELVGYAECQEISAEMKLNNAVKGLLGIVGIDRKEEFEKELTFWTCFKKGVIAKHPAEDDLERLCGSAGGYEGELAERARTKSLID